MNPLVLSVTIPASVLQLQIGTSEEIITSPSAEVPELQALHHYAGDWEDEITGKPGVRRTESAAWILRGRFLRQTWAAEAGDGLPTASGMTVMTFDSERGLYRQWAFLATGSMIEAEGVWSAEDRCFTWGRRVDGTMENVVTKAAFPAEGMQAWSIVKTDSQGKILREISGQSRRKSTLTLQPPA